MENRVVSDSQMIIIFCIADLLLMYILNETVIFLSKYFCEKD